MQMFTYFTSAIKTWSSEAKILCDDACVSLRVEKNRHFFIWLLIIGDVKDYPFSSFYQKSVNLMKYEITEQDRCATKVKISQERIEWST